MNADNYFTNRQLKYYLDKYAKSLSERGLKGAGATSSVVDFKLDKVIGCGSFGQVYSGFDMKNGRPIAVKQVPITAFGTHSVTQQKKVKALEHEIKLLESLSHENIVNYLGTL